MSLGKGLDGYVAYEVGGDSIVLATSGAGAVSATAIPTLTNGSKPMFVRVSVQGDWQTSGAGGGVCRLGGVSVAAVVATGIYIEFGSSEILRVGGHSHISFIRKGATNNKLSVTPLSW